MHLVMCGCEYTGTTTMGREIVKWAHDTFGTTQFSFHDHFKIPHLSHPPGHTHEENDAIWQAWDRGEGPDPTMAAFSDEEQQQILDLSPQVKEMFQRYHVEYHLQESFYRQYPHHSSIGLHIDEAVYGPYYFDYGGIDQYSDRRVMARHVEQKLNDLADDHILILVKAAPEVIRARMRANPHPNQLVKNEDVEYILDRFEEEYEKSLLPHKFTIDTSVATLAQCMEQFKENVRPILSRSDKALIAEHLARTAGSWI